MAEFAIGDADFLLDGQPFRILSGALHYFRVHPDQWADRIDKARRMGLNTIETYVPWNAHAPERGTFDLAGGLDLDRFLGLIADAGMHAIVRPGPYICAEWDNGGLPTWLPEEGVRSCEPGYLDAVREYLSQVYRVVVPHQVDRGGPVLLVQIENEYGAYGSDHRYLAELTRHTRESGITVPLTTVDQPLDDMLAAGGLDGLHRTASFGSRTAERLAVLRAHQPTGPLMCSEFWCGWFDHWGAHHHTTSVEESAAELDALLAAGASVNIYMFHGGTNFGLTNGANDKGTYQPIVTSYDYDAPLDEAGNPTAKYHAFRDVIARYHKVPDSVPPPAQPLPTPVTSLHDPFPLLAAPGHREQWPTLPAFDDLTPTPRLMLARTQIASDGPAVLVFGEIRDRVTVFLDGVRLGTLLREHHDEAVGLPVTSGELTLLIEDLGRVDYGPRLGEPKGIMDGVSLHGRALTGWDVLPIDAATLPDRCPGSVDGPAVTGPLAGPVLVRGRLTVAESTDLFLDTAGWGKGMVWFNGFLLGRYWRRGPQRTLYVPAPLVRAGANDVVVLELDTMIDPVVRCAPLARLGHTEA